MFDKLCCCLLCLESIDDQSKYIDLDSANAKKLKVQEIIGKYFTEEVFIKTQISVHIVCQECWSLVHTFHNFHQRIQKAHTAAGEALQSLNQLQLETKVIKLEVDQSPETDPPLPKRRGRPRKCRNSQIKESQNEKTIFVSKCDMQIGGLQPSFQINKKTELMEDEIPLVDIKYEALQEDILDVPVLKTEGDKSFLQDNIASKKTLSKNKCHEKRNKRIAKSLKIAEADEFIAKNFPLTCSLCKIPLADFTVLKHHFRTAHQTQGYVLCCGKKLPKRGVLVDHIHVHQNPNYFKCETCGKVTTDRRGLELHKQHIHGLRGRGFQCNICNKDFFRHSLLSRHYLSHSPEEIKTFPCTDCGKIFPSDYIMQHHKRVVHLNVYAKICDICGKSIRGKDALQRHQQEHTGLPIAPVKCNLCDAELTTKYGLARHIKTMHTEEFQTPQVCPFCSKVSPTMQAHQNHVKYMHKIGRRHECKMCNKAFKLPTGLKEHMATHTGETLYTCNFCPKTFNSKSNMYSHRKSLHPKEWAENFSNKRKAKRSSPE